MIRREYKEEGIQSLIWYGLILVFVTVLIYAPSLRGGFVSEDAENILNNPAFQKIENAPSLFVKPPEAGQHWRPLTSLSFMLDYILWKSSPTGFRLTNLILHVICSLLCFAVLARLSKEDIKIALIASLLFALHPLHTENVAWISGRAEILGGIFFFAALLSCFLLSVKFKDFPIFYILLPIFFVLGLLAHEGVVILSLVVIFTDLVWKREKIKYNLPRVYFPLLLIAAAYLGLSIFVFRMSIAMPNHIARIVAQLLYLTLFPLRLTVFYSAKTLPGMGFSVVACCLLLAAAVLFRKKKIIFFGLGLFILTIVGVSLVSFDFPMIEGMSYYAVIGICLFISAALWHLAKSGGRYATSPNRIAAYVIGISLLGFYSVRTYIRSEHWADDFSLWSAEAKTHPDSALVLNNLGRAYYGRSGLAAMAEKNFRKAIESKPDYLPPYLNLARLLIDSNRIEEAEKILEQTVSSSGEGDDKNYVILAMLYQEIGKEDLAEKMYAKTIQINPRNATALSELGRIAFERGDYQKSVEYMTESLKGDLAARRAQVLSNRASAYYRLGKVEEALADLRLAMVESPQLANPYLLMAEIEAKRKFAEKSVAVLEEALQKVPQPPFEIYLALHNLYMEFKQPQKAFDILYDYQNRMPNDIRGHMAIGEFCLKMYLLSPEENKVHLGNAAKSFKNAVKLNPRDIRALIFYGKTAAISGAAEQARKIWEQVLKLEPDNPEVHALLKELPR